MALPRLTVPIAMCLLFALTGCAKYQTPGGAASFQALGITPTEQEVMTDADISEALAVKPAASFPASIAVAHVQDRGYSSYTARGYDLGRVSLVIDEVELDPDVQRQLDALPMIAGFTPLNRLVVDSTFRSSAGEADEQIRTLRTAAARVQADMLFVYTFDTRFGVENVIPALGVITLGLFPNDEARVTSVASGALIDTRTGYVYGLASGSDRQTQLANAWTNQDAVDQSRRRAERNAFNAMATNAANMWQNMVWRYAPRGGSAMP